MRYWAEVYPDGNVLRVVVADEEWIAANPSNWVETSDPYADDGNPVVYAGPGMGCDETFPEKFAVPWKEWDGHNESLYQTDDLVFHNGRIWRCTTINNPFEPGVSGWQDSPATGNPIWIQPTGQHDVYAAGAIVDHNDATWESQYDNNVWEPGVFGWTQV